MQYLVRQYAEPPELGWPKRRRHEVYWPEIDGLRTIAVGSVLIFHLDARLLRGGFAGVDVFFVISGYLITTLLMIDIQSGNFSIYEFYQRRIARLAPASLLVVAVTMIAGYFIYSAQDLALLGTHGLAATLSVINMKLIFQGNYFADASDAQPLRHYWSLSVEEQFYVIFPIFLYFIIKNRRLLTVLLLCSAMSFAVCAAATAVAPTAAFYLLPSRAWELLAGSSLAIARGCHLTLDEKTSCRCLAAGLILIPLSLAAIPNDGFPGWIAVLPVAGSLLVIAGVGNGQGIIQRFLAHPAMAFTGKRSYSFYLWHWPVFSFVDYHFFLRGPVFVTTVKITATVCAALAGYRCIERPARLWLNSAPRAITFGAFVVATAILGMAGYVIRYHYYLGTDPGSIATGGISVNREGRARIAVIGDSEGAMYGYELASIARASGLRLNALSVMGRNELPGEPDTLWPSVSRFLDTTRPDVVILAQAWSLKLADDGKSRFGAAIAALLDRAARIIVITQPPIAPQEASRSRMLAGAKPPFFEDPAAREGRIRAGAIIRTFACDRVRVLDVADIFLNADNSIRLIGPDGRLTFVDGLHLSDTGTALVRSRLEQALRDALPAAEQP